MDKISAGEQWKMNLLTGATSASDATDMLLESRMDMSNEALLEVLLPMAELRASQIEQGLESAEESTRIEAARMQARYNREPVQAAPVQEAHKTAANLSDVTPLTRAVAGNWLGKILANDLVGEMEKELDRTVKTYKAQQQDNQIHLTHGVAQGMAR